MKDQARFPISHKSILRSVKVSLALLLFFGVSVRAQAQPSLLASANYYNLREGLGNSIHIFKTKKSATVAFLGGSITYNPGWRENTCAYLKQQYPKVNFHFIAAGIPSLGSLPHAFRVKQDVLDSGKVDLLFLEAAVNDQVNGTDSLTQLYTLEGIVRQARKSNPKMDIIMMSFADPDKTKIYNSGHVPVSVANHERIADYYHLPSINLAKEIRDRLANKEFDWDRDFRDLHPSPFGQQLYFNTIKQLIHASAEVEQAKIQKHSLPKPLHPANFEKGIYVGVEKAVADQSWTLEKDWEPKDGISTRPGFVHVPVLSSTRDGATLTFNFVGNAVGMAVVSGPDAGIVRYSIDGTMQGEIDLYTPWSSSLHLPWYVLFGKNLEAGSHTLKIEISKKKNNNSKGTACRIVHFLVNK